MVKENGEDTTFSFGDFELDSARRRLLKKGEIVPLNSKAFDLLFTLIENRGQLLTKDEIFQRVWEGQFVEENNLTVHISALRKIFGEKKGEPRFILTIPGKGYKFIAEVRLINSFQTLQLQQINQTINPFSDNSQDKFEELFIGRTNEISEIKNLLKQSEVRLVTLTGTGGTGKTRLAQKVARELKTDFPNAVFFVELAAANEADSVVSTIAQTLEVSESSGKSLFESIAEFLQKRRALLVLDNFEHLLFVAPLVKELLEAVASLKLLITSRAPLRLKNECEYLVKPLDLPPTDAAFSLEEFAEYPSILLFCKKAQAVKPIFLLSNENISAVVKICQRLDGLPLAIELAAARVTLLSPNSILNRLENSLNLLTGGTKDSPVRQRTMREAIQWSYDLLEESERFLFRRLAVFAGGFTVESVESFLETEKKEKGEETKKRSSSRLRAETSVFDILESLLEKNLLVAKEQTDGNVRLRLLEIVREFAFEMLEESGEIADLERIHANYFLSLAEEAEKFLLSEIGNQWLGRLENEHDNFRAALNWALKNDGEIAARIAAALRFFWLNQGHLSEGLRLSKVALQKTENKFSEARSKLLLSNGLFLRNQGDLESARKSYQRSLEESTALGDSEQIIKANQGLAAVALLQKDFASAQKYNEKSLALSREINDEMLIAYSLCSLADLEMSKENLSAAKPLLEECLSLSKKLGNNRLLTTVYFNLGTVDFLESRYDRANFNLTESLRFAHEMGNKTMISCSLEGFAALAAISGNAEQSVKLTAVSETLRESIGYRLEPAEEVFRDNYLKKVRSVLDEKSFIELYRKGKKTDLDEMISILLNRKQLEKKTAFIETKNDELTEFIIENHKIERITIDEKIESHSLFANLIFSRQKRVLFVGLFLLLFLLAIIGYFFQRSYARNSFAFQQISVKQVTTNGKVSIAALSPDGKLFAYVTSSLGERSLWLGNVEGGNHLQLRSASDALYHELEFSPDSNELYFSLRDDKNPNSTLYKMPVAGGAANKIFDEISNFRVSPDGHQIAFVHFNAETNKNGIYISNLDGSGKREIASFPTNVSLVGSSIEWSFDGKKLAFGGSKDAESLKQDIFVVELASGEIKQITTNRWQEITNIRWLADGTGFIVTALAENFWSSVPQFRIWYVAFPGGETHEITHDRSSYGPTLGLSVNHNIVISVEHRQLNNIWIAPIEDLSQARQVTFSSFGKYDGLWGLDWTPSGKLIYTNSDTISTFISQMNTDGTEQKPLTAPGTVDSVLMVSPDGRYIVFHSNRTGGFDIWRMDSDGANLVRLTEGQKSYQPFISADSRWVYYKSWLSGKGELCRVSINGGAPEILNDKETSWGSASPNGKFLAASYVTDKSRLAIFSAETNQLIKQFDLPKTATLFMGSHWTPDSRAVVYRDNSYGYWQQSINGGEPQRLEGIPKEKLYNFAYSKDGKWFAFVRGTEIRDVVLIRNSEK